MRKGPACLLTSLLLAFLAPAAGPTAQASAPTPSPGVIAIIESNGVNVLHKDFALAPGQQLRLPPGIPKPEWLSLPQSGTFEERLAEATAGPLGNLEDDRLYWIKGTRLGIYMPEGTAVTSIFDNRFHATGTTSAAIGREHGTNPQALAVIVPDASTSGWQWLTDQAWIDAISTSYYTLFSGGSSGAETCPAVPYMRKIADQGRLIFSAAGNVEQTGIASAPAGAAYTYQVGGTDDDGRTYIPGPDNQGPAVTPTRPYETGDRFEFPSADENSLDGSMAFGGTSGATPSTAGRAVELLQHARSILGSTWTGVRDGALAIARRGAAVPTKGPLADGRLERDEFHDLLHHVAIPSEPASPLRYMVEGFGALNPDAIAVAKRVLAGQAEVPDRSQEDAMHDAIEAVRPLLFPGARCG